jgi:hypothetical protein
MANLSTPEQPNLPNDSKVLRQMYGASEYVWRTWLEPLRDIIPYRTRTYTPIQIDAIIKEIGMPKLK